MRGVGVVERVLRLMMMVYGLMVAKGNVLGTWRQETRINGSGGKANVLCFGSSRDGHKVIFLNCSNLLSYTLDYGVRISVQRGCLYSGNKAWTERGKYSHKCHLHLALKQRRMFKIPLLVLHMPLRMPPLKISTSDEAKNKIIHSDSTTRSLIRYQAGLEVKF